MRKNDNDTILLFKLTVLSAIKTIRNKKKCDDKDSIFDYLTKSLPSNIEMELLEHVLTTLIKNNIVINKKTPTGLSSFFIADDSLDSQNEVNNLIENNQEELNLDFNENSPLPNYNIDTPYSHQVVSRPKKAKDELNLEARFTVLKNYIECEISRLDSKFQSVCNKLKTVNIQEYETMKTLQNRIDFLQNEVASRSSNQIVIGNADWEFGPRYTNCTSSDKDKIINFHKHYKQFIHSS